MAVRECLLALLSERPSSGGYRLKAEFDTATAGTWPVNVGQVYATLDRLVRDGAVASEEVDGQRSYSITEDGLAELGAWWETTPEDEPPQRDELMLKVLLAAMGDLDHAREVIQLQRSSVTSLLQHHTRRMRASARRPGSLTQQLVGEALMTRAEADVRWLDRVEQLLVDAARAGADGDEATAATT